MLGKNALFVGLQLFDQRLPIGRIFALQKNGHVIAKCTPFVVHQVRAMYGNASGDERPADDWPIHIAYKVLPKRFESQSAAETRLVMGECRPAITRKGDENGTHETTAVRTCHKNKSNQASGMSGSTSFINFSNDSCQPR